MTGTSTLRIADLPHNRPTAFDLRPEADMLAALQAELDLAGLRKVRLSGTLSPEGRTDWRLRARLGATVVQPCSVTLEPVTTRIDAEVLRHYVADLPEPEGDEVEMPEDDSQEPLQSHVDLRQVLAEALALNLPLYPRAPGAELGEAVFTEPGKAPMTDEAARPFAGLSVLRGGRDGED